MPINATITPTANTRVKVTPQQRLLVTNFRQNIGDFSLGDLINVNIVDAANGSLLAYNSNTTYWEVSSDLRIVNNAILTVDTDQDLVIAPNGNGAIDVSGSRITNIGTPTSNTDAVPYSLLVDTIAATALSFAGNNGISTSVSNNNVLITLAISGSNGVSTSVVNNAVIIDLDDTGISAGDYGDPDAVATLSVDAKGRITGIANMLIDIASTQVNDFAEATQDVVGGMLAGTQTGLSVTYDDPSGTLNFAANPFTITLTGPVTGSAIVTDLANVSITTSLSAGTITLGGDTTGDYVETLLAGTGVNIANTGGEGSSPTISIGQDVSASANVSFNKVTADLLGNANTATALQTSRSIILTGDVSGYASFDGSANASISVTIEPNSVTLGTDTTGDYVSTITVTPNTGINISGNSGETASVTLSGIDANNTVKGVASFNANNFSVVTGAVSIITIDGGSY